MKLLNGALIGCNADKIREVYGPGNLERLHRLCSFREKIFTASDAEAGELSDIDVLFSTWGMPCFTEEQMAKMPRLQAVFYAAGATDRFCQPLFRHGIRLFSAWKANAVPVAEFTLALIILGLKNYFNLSPTIRSSRDFRNGQTRAGRGMYGARVALLGAGMISNHLQNLLKNFHVEVIVVPSHPAKRTISLEEAFATSQVVSNHFPDRDDNVGVFTGRMFASLPPGAVFINTGRGRQVNEEEMIAVLEQRPDLTALLDVTFPEPPEDGSKLFTLPNVHLSPHIAGSLHDELFRMSDYMVDDFERYLAGEPVLNEVDPTRILTAG